MYKLRFVFLIVGLFLIVPALQILNLNSQKDRFIIAGKSKSTFIQKIDIPRKKIVDRNNNVLASSILRATLIFKNKEEKRLAQIFAQENGEKIFLSSNRRLYFESSLSSKFIRDLKKYCECKIIKEDVFRRYYPYGSIVSPLLGFAGIDGGLEGLEKSFDSLLSSKQIKETFLRDAKQKKVKGNLENFNNNFTTSGLRLTIDISLQHLLFNELKKSISYARAKGGSAIAMNAKNGEILALVSFPSFNPNNSQRVAVRNKAIDDLFEPGSLIKPLTVAGALSNNVITKESLINTNPGFITISGFKKTEAGGKNFGVISPKQIISKSSQIGIAKIAIEMHQDKIVENLYNFGIGEDLNINWLGFLSGNLINKEKLYDIDKASIGYGYLMHTNLLQIARAYSVFANNGFRVEPKIIYGSETVLKKVISADIANYVLESLRETITDGTALNLKNSSIEIAGKTGTTEKYIVGEGYVSGKYISSFASIFPYDDPEFIVIVSIDEPDPDNYFAGSVAAPFVKNISNQVISFGRE